MGKITLFLPEIGSENRAAHPPPRNLRSTLRECLLISPFLTSLVLIIIAVIVINSDREGGRQLR